MCQKCTGKANVRLGLEVDLTELFFLHFAYRWRYSTMSKDIIHFRQYANSHFDFHTARVLIFCQYAVVPTRFVKRKLPSQLDADIPYRYVYYCMLTWYGGKVFE